MRGRGRSLIWQFLPLRQGVIFGGDRLLTRSFRERIKRRRRRQHRRRPRRYRNAHHYPQRRHPTTHTQQTDQSKLFITYHLVKLRAPRRGRVGRPNTYTTYALRRSNPHYLLCSHHRLRTSRRVGNVRVTRARAYTVPIERRGGRAGEQAPARTVDEHRTWAQSRGVKGIIAPDPGEQGTMLV